MRAEGECGGRLAGAERRIVADFDGNRRLGLAGAVEVRGKGAAEILENPGAGLLGLAEPGQNDPAEPEIGRRHDCQELALFAAEARG